MQLRSIAHAGCNKRIPTAQRARKHHYRPILPAMAISVVLLAVTVLLLQLGMGKAMYTAESAPHPVASALAAMHPHACGSDKSPTGDCPPQQCSSGARPACHCSCTQIPLLVAGELTFVANAPAMTAVGDIPGTVSQRLDRPFRPPA